MRRYNLVTSFIAVSILNIIYAYTLVTHSQIDLQIPDLSPQILTYREEDVEEKQPYITSSIVVSIDNCK